MPRPCLNEESGTARRVPRSHDHHRGYVLSPRQIVTRAERIVDHMGPSRPSASGLGSRPCRLSHLTGRQMKSQPYPVSSTSLNRSETFPIRFARRGRVGDRCLRDAPTWPAPATEAHRHWPRLNICGLRRAMRRGHARGRHQWVRLPFFRAGRISPEQRGSRGFGSVKPL